ncbi:hypothetical protein J4422_00190 [Candidatus Pacearchaeota archaeon]|nr:hypothetical protein [Candidatus Pacearchaeota archaeon]
METKEETFKCESCNRIFGSKEALEMHGAAKHPEKVPKDKKRFPVKKTRNWVIFILILGLVIFGVYFLMTSSNSFDDLPASEINIGSHKNIALHIHSDLEIKINNQGFPIPADIGIQTGIMRPLHTHDSSGEVHIEGPYARDFTIGEFFQIWNKTFNSTCIFENCIGTESNSTLKMSVNGQESQQFENHIMRDGDEIVIEFTSA